MGLITKEVIMKWNSKNKEWYESKGYKYTKMKNEFEIRAEDLKDGSKVSVDVQCDCCIKVIKNVTWQNYKKYVKDDKKYYCQECATALFARDKMQKTKLKSGKSFEQCCIENNRQDILDRWDYELNDCKPNDILFKSHKKYYFKCPRGIHKSELKRISDFTAGHDGVMDCKECNSIAQWGIDNLGEDFLIKYWSKDNIGNPWEVRFNSPKKIYIKCQIKNYHGDYETSCLLFIKGNRCPYCTGYSGKVHKLDSIGYLFPGVLKIWSDKNNKSIYEYLPKSNKKVWWKCSEDKHSDYKRSIDASHKAEFRCPECTTERDESILQEKVRLYLQELKYTVLHERNCTLIPQNPKHIGSRGQMPFDNEIKELKLVIEVQGQQHYNIGNFHVLQAKKKKTTPEYELHMQKVRDRYKRIYAKSQGYNYLEIPYWKDNEKESWKQLIDDKIESIIDIRIAI